jgi:hypothetical protein
MGPMLTVQGSEVPPEYQAALTVQQRLDLDRSVRYCQEVLGIEERARQGRGRRTTSWTQIFPACF